MRALRQRAKGTLSALDYDVRHRPEEPSLGVDPFADMRKILSDPLRTVVFDVGANVGQTIELLKRYLPTCDIHAFEPDPNAYRSLSERIRDFSDVHPNAVAVGRVPGQMDLLQYSLSHMSSFLQPGESCWGEVVGSTHVDVITLNDYALENDVRHVDLLRTDTQGYDLEVLKGAKRLLSKHRIQLVLMEVIDSDLYRDLPSLDAIYAFMTNRGFRLVSFYDTHYQGNIASRSDALYLNTSFRPDAS